MAKPKDSKIESLLRKVVKDAVKKENEITIRIARSMVEAELGLEDGFLKNDLEWKGKSKAIIEAAFQEDDAPHEAVTVTPVKSITKARPADTPKSANERGKAKAQPQQRSKQTPPEPLEIPNSTSKAPEPAPAKPVEAQIDQSEGDSSEGSSEDEEDETDEAAEQAHVQQSATLKKPDMTAPKVNGVKRKANDQATSDATESDDDDEVDTDDEHKDKKAKVDSTSGSEESSEEGDFEDSDDEDGPDGPTKEAETQQTPEHISQPTLKTIPPKTYRPPSGYTALTSDHLQDVEAFSSGNVDGKQIWHITAPSNLPLSTITDIALEDIQAGTQILTHDSFDYVIHEDPSESSDNIALLVPAKDGYRRFEQKVDRSLRIKQKITLPNLSMRQASQDTGSIAAGEIAQPSTTAIRPQPKGLRMRYKPPGFGRGRPGRIGSESDSAEDEEAEQSNSSKAAFQFPRALGGHGTSVEEVAGGTDTTADVRLSTPKKKRKEKKALDVSPVLTNGVSASPVPGTVVSANKPEDTHGSPLPNGVGLEAESTEEKARRKEEKRLKRERKEAKRKAQEAGG